MEPADSMSHSQRLVSILSRINIIPCVNTYFLRSILVLSSQLRASFRKGFFSVNVPIKIVKAFLHCNNNSNNNNNNNSNTNYYYYYNKHYWLVYFFVCGLEILLTGLNVFIYKTMEMKPVSLNYNHSHNYIRTKF